MWLPWVTETKRESKVGCKWETRKMHTFISLLFLSGRGQTSSFFTASFRLSLKTHHLVHGFALTHSLWCLLYQSAHTCICKRMDHLDNYVPSWKFSLTVCWGTHLICKSWNKFQQKDLKILLYVSVGVSSPVTKDNCVFVHFRMLNPLQTDEIPSLEWSFNQPYIRGDLVAYNLQTRKCNVQCDVFAITLFSKSE